MGRWVGDSHSWFGGPLGIHEPIMLRFPSRTDKREIGHPTSRIGGRQGATFCCKVFLIEAITPLRFGEAHRIAGGYLFASVVR